MNFYFFGFFADFDLGISLIYSCGLEGTAIFSGTFFLGILVLSVSIFFPICFLICALYFLFTSLGKVFNFYRCS